MKGSKAGSKVGLKGQRVKGLKVKGLPLTFLPFLTLKMHLTGWVAFYLFTCSEGAPL